MNLQNTRRAVQKGFTLIELAIIIAVLAILGSVGAVKLASMNTEARNSAALSDLANVRSALAMATAKNTTGTIGLTQINSYLEPAAVGLTDTNLDWNDYNVFVETATGSIVSIKGLAGKSTSDKSGAKAGTQPGA